jgi:hypothetical protein
MAAFRKRTLFAAPFIMVAAAGCKDDSRTSNPPPPIRTSNPPEPSAPKFRNQWDVRRVDAGKCQADEDFNCPPNAKCNPPEPRAIECPAGTSGKTVIRVAETEPGSCWIVPKDCKDTSCVKHKAACPLPPGGKLPDKLVEVWIVEKDKQGDGCHAEEPVDCPPGKDCNPPSPMKIACPPGVSATKTLKVGMLPDKTCAILPDDCKSPDCAKDKTPCPTN